MADEVSAKTAAFSVVALPCTENTILVKTSFNIISTAVRGGVGRTQVRACLEHGEREPAPRRFTLRLFGGWATRGCVWEQVGGATDFVSPCQPSPVFFFFAHLKNQKEKGCFPGSVRKQKIIPGLLTERRRLNERAWEARDRERATGVTSTRTSDDFDQVATHSVLATMQAPQGSGKHTPHTRSPPKKIQPRISRCIPMMAEALFPPLRRTQESTLALSVAHNRSMRKAFLGYDAVSWLRRSPEARAVVCPSCLSPATRGNRTKRPARVVFTRALNIFRGRRGGERFPPCAREYNRAS